MRVWRFRPISRRKKPKLWLVKKPAICLSALFLVSPLGADTLTPAQQYNQRARDVINRCSRVVIEYEFLDPQIGPDFIPTGSVSLTPKDAEFLASAIEVDRAISQKRGLDSDNWPNLALHFYNGKTEVGDAGSHATRDFGYIVLLPRQQPDADYFLTPKSAKALRDWVLKQPHLAKKVPH